MLTRFLALALVAASTSAGAFQNEMYPTAEELEAAERATAPDPLAAAKTAAAQNDPSAMNKLGKMYEQGQGVGKDPVEALKWYLLASARDKVDGGPIMKNRDSLMRLLDKKQVAEARRRASQWQPGK
jgi:TPR repeat protein